VIEPRDDDATDLSLPDAEVMVPVDRTLIEAFDMVGIGVLKSQCGNLNTDGKFEGKVGCIW
jgi:hypothetical protein